MKIGIMFKPFGNGHARFGADRFLKIKQKGFCAVDYGMADTDAPLYSWDDETFETECVRLYAVEKELTQQ